jgi:Protein of unknown function DUF72
MKKFPLHPGTIPWPAILIGTSGWHYDSRRGPFFSEGSADQEPAAILGQPVSNRRTQWRVLSDADAGSGQKRSEAGGSRQGMISCLHGRHPNSSPAGKDCQRTTSRSACRTITMRRHRGNAPPISSICGGMGRAAVTGGHYRPDVLADWARRISSWKMQGSDVFVYLDNDQKSAAPADALKLRQLLVS